MKKLILLFLSFSFIVSAQQKIFLDKNNEPVTSEQEAVKYKLLSSEKIDDKVLYCEAFFKMNDKPISEYRYTEIILPNADKPLKRKEGLQKVWYDKEKPKIVENYKNGSLEGEFLTYWKNGNLKRKDIYKENKLLSGQCFDSLSNEITHFPYMQMPEFPGGDKALFKFLSDNLRYPVDAAKKGKQGRVILQFVITPTGEVDKIEVVRRVSPELDLEALRIVSLMSLWKPGKIDGELARIKYTLPVNFRLQ